MPKSVLSTIPYCSKVAITFWPIDIQMSVYLLEIVKKLETLNCSCLDRFLKTELAVRAVVLFSKSICINLELFNKIDR